MVAGSGQRRIASADEDEIAAQLTILDGAGRDEVGVQSLLGVEQAKGADCRDEFLVRRGDEGGVGISRRHLA